MRNWLAAPLLWLMAFSAGAESERSIWNMPVGVTEISREVYGLHMLIFWAVVIIGVLVFAAFFYSIWAHRRSRNPKPATFHESTTVEIVWTIIPFIILIGMAIPATGTLIKIEDTGDAEMSIKVTGYQWMWGYEYVGEDVSFISRLDRESDLARQVGSGIDPSTVDNYLLEVDNRLIVPVDTKIRFLLTANDVIHSWWVPDLGMKRDAIPGFINEMWAKIDEPGIYRGQCAELCGRDHGFMPVVVEALPKDEYESWLAEQKGDDGTQSAEAEGQQMASADDAGTVSDAADAGDAEAAAEDEPAEEMELSALMETGEKVYRGQCVACHQASGEGMPPAFPSLHGSAVVTGDSAEQISQILKGKNAMPPFGHLSDEEVAAVVTFTRNSWDNDSGVVQPADVAELRQ
ncbi:cytochrome c oxidase subunit II [Algiphilus aromaticivorans]|uniref:cytochrome c oxidase subunit II n=1 Tax=Algiphilus aromaticivorans TaxID=382454 RepID=UPI0009FCD119|nr:cytochrome c oxidase subunit II [Algiphilus aromaticivorans]